MRPLVLSSAAMAALLFVIPVRADDEALARTLFDEGIKALDAGEVDKACPKLEESLRLKANANVQFYLAECFERQGKTASAWTNFLGASAKSKEAGKLEKANEAKARADALQSKLVWVTIVVDDPIEGLEVTRAGSVVPKAQWGVALPVDPGEIVVTASAPKKEAFRTKVLATTEGAKLTVTVRPLDDAPTPKKVELPPEPKPVPNAVASKPVEKTAVESGGSGATWPLILSGAAVIGGGVALQLMAAKEQSQISEGGYAKGSDISSAESKVNTYRGLGWAACGIGGGLFLSGVIVGLATSGSSTPVSVGVGPRSVALSMTWRLP